MTNCKNLLSNSVQCVTQWTAARQASQSMTNSWSLVKFMSIKLVIPSNHLILFRPLLPHLQYFPASWSFPVSQFTSGGQSIGVSALASVLPMNVQDWFLLDRLVGSPCSPRDTQVSSLTSQFKSFNSSALSFVYESWMSNSHIHTWLLEAQ